MNQIPMLEILTSPPAIPAARHRWGRGTVLTEGNPTTSVRGSQQPTFHAIPVLCQREWAIFKTRPNAK